MPSRATVIYDEEKRAITHTLLEHCFKRVDPIESRRKPVLSMLSMSEVARCPPAPISDDPSAQ